MTTSSFPVRYCFDLALLREAESKLVRSAHAPNTFLAYAQSWKRFSEWCRESGRGVPLPATPEQVREFVAWSSQIRTPASSPQTISLAAAAIRHYHVQAGLPSPVDPSVLLVLTAVRRLAARRGARTEKAGKKHLTVEQLTRMCRTLGASPQDVRDRALLLLGFTSALRRSDIARLRTSHVTFLASSVRVWVALSKSDQEGEGREVYLDQAKDPLLCPVRALQAWRALRVEYFGNFQGSLFLRCTPGGDAIQAEGLREVGICKILKRHLARVGENSRDYGAHSMRSGMITAADDAGASLRSIMDHTGHRSLSTVMRYIKSTRGSNPLKGVL